MFSSMTIASSTTKPTESVNAMSERLSREYPPRYITAKVPTKDNGSARLGIVVAEIFLKNRKITMITRKSANSSVNFTSLTELRMVIERSNNVYMVTEGGRGAFRRGIMALIL